MDRERHAAIWVRMLSEGEIRMARDSVKILRSGARAASNAYKEGGESFAIAAINKYKSAWMQLLVATYARIIKRFSDYTASYLLGTKAQNFDSWIQTFIKTQGLDKVEMLTNTSRDTLKLVIANGVKDGLGQDDIARDIVKKMGGVSANLRAKTIARTEVHTAASFAAHVTAATSELPMTKEWVAVEDERTREAHTQADGQIVDINSSFEVDGEQLAYPGDPSGSEGNTINCRCAALYSQRATHEFIE